MSLAMFGLLLAAASSTADASPVEVEMDAIEITAARVYPVDADAVDSALTTSFSTSINRDQWVQDSQNVTDVLRQNSGVQIRNTGGAGGFSFVSLRGASADQVAVFLDGFLLNDSEGGGVNLSNFSLSELDSIEIYRGLVPLQIGRSPIGGAVVLRSRRVQTGSHYSATTGAGNQQKYNFSLHANQANSRFPFSATLDYLSSANNFIFNNDNGTKWNLVDDQREHRLNNGYKRLNGMMRTTVPVSGGDNINASYRYFESLQQMPSWNNRSINTDFSTRTQHGQIRYNVFRFSPILNKAGLVFDADHREENYNDQYNQVGLGAQIETSTTNSYSFQVYAEKNKGQTIFASHLDLNVEDYHSHEVIKAIDLENHTRSSLGAGFNLTHMMMKDRLLVRPGILLQSFGDDQGVFVNRLTGQYHYISPQLGFNYYAASNLVFKTNIARTLRRPTFYEMYGDRGLFIGNSELRAERSTNIDAGFEWKVKPQNIVEKIEITTAVFSNVLDDGIVKVFSAQGVGRADNVSNARIYGIETSCNAEILRHLSFSYNLTGLKTENLTTDSMYYGKSLPGRYAQSQSVRFSPRFNSFSFYTELLFQSGLYYDSMNLLPAKDRLTTNMGMKMVFTHSEVSARMDNVFYRQYQDFNGYPYADRTIMVSYKLEY